jgi:hypothetical protein
MKRLSLLITLAAPSMGCIAPSIPVGELETNGSTAATDAGTSDHETTADASGETDVESATGTGTGIGTDTEISEPPGVCDALDVMEACGIPPEGDDFVWAWTGDRCKQLCECAGPDCDLVDSDHRSCLEARLGCPTFTESCPLQEGNASLEGPIPLSMGAFGIGQDELQLAFSTSVLDMAGWSHTISAEYHSQGADGVQVRLPIVDAPGEYPVIGRGLGSDLLPPWSGTVTITEIVTEGDPGTWHMSGTLSVVRDDGRLSAEGNFTGIPGCAALTWD